MKIQQFLEHHGVATNPFLDEDAQTDLVFKNACIRSVYHPAWDKIYGNPTEPATAVVFGEKGSGKTALRLQMVRHLTDHNADHPDHQVFVIQYDDFNPYLDRFRDRLFRRRAERVLNQWRLWDHMDAVLSLGVTQLVDRLLRVKHARHPAARDELLRIENLDAAQRRDVLLLAACYDQSTGESRVARWHQLRRVLNVHNWLSKWDMAVGGAVTVAALLLVLGLGTWNWFKHPWIYLFLAGGWAPWAWRFVQAQLTAWRIGRSTRTLRQEASTLRRLLLAFPPGKLADQPLPNHSRTDDRYELLGKFQGVLQSLGFIGIVVLVDRVDEPYLINGSVDLMRALVWPLLDNKFLKHPGLGVKLLLPSDLERLLDKEDQDFHQRARLDKQNLIRGLPWTGQALFDLATARLRACAREGHTPSLLDWFDPAIQPARLLEAFAQLRVPRNLFKFLYRLMMSHCNATSDEAPSWRIPLARFESELGAYTISSL
jgi:hypothetical protein